jgi:bilirubin oxidase
LHDAHFYILDRNGNPPSAVESGRKDVLLIEPNEVVRFIAKFSDFADTSTPYMYHCHILMHEDDGMMGQFKVGTEYSAVNSQPITGENARIFPNPANTFVNIELPGVSGEGNLTVYDMLGRTVFEGFVQKRISINTANWPRGHYFLSIVTNSATIHKELTIE